MLVFSKKTIAFLYFISALIFVISFFLLPSFFFLLFLVPLHVQMDCLFEGFVCLFPEEGCITTNFPLRTALFGSHRFWTVYFYLYMSSIFFLFFLHFLLIFFSNQLVGLVSYCLDSLCLWLLQFFLPLLVDL